MRRPQKIAQGVLAIAAAVALATTGAVAAPPALAAEPCRAGALCLYRNTGFINMKLMTQRTGQIFYLDDYGLEENVFSYVNNLPVTVNFYDWQGAKVWSIRPGGSSSDSSSFKDEYVVYT